MSDKQAEIPEVTPEVVACSLAGGRGVVVDVREQEELRQGHIREAIHIPLGELHLRANDIPRDTDVFMLCHVGQRSAMATEFLRQLGHERVWNIRGGIIGWMKSGLPLSKGGTD